MEETVKLGGQERRTNEADDDVRRVGRGGVGVRRAGMSCWAGPPGWGRVMLGPVTPYITSVAFTNSVFPCSDRAPNAAVPRWNANCMVPNGGR